MQIHYSNRLECLADALSERLREPGPPALAPELISVPHAGMARWLSLAIAKRLGIAANLQFPLPATFIWSLLRGLSPHLEARSAYEPAVLKWAVLGQLPALAGGSPGGEVGEGAGLGRYLAVADELMRYELAERIAGCLDRYLVYRPDWIHSWSGGGDPFGPDEASPDRHWQMILWRRLERTLGKEHWPAVSRSVAVAIRQAAGPQEGRTLPERAFVFGVTSFSPSYLSLLGELSERISLELFVLNPCREYWGDILSPRKVLEQSGAAGPESLHLTHGNPLLASLGRVGRESIDALQELAMQEREHFVAAPPAAGLLGQLQNDILELRDRTAEPATAGASAPGDDRSIQVHACHGPAREMEVLHDQLLALFDAEPDLDPGEVVVMCPDLRLYTASIEAVFGAAGAEHRIPFAIADRPPVEASPVIGGFFQVLDVAASRFRADQVCALLDRPAVCRRFRIDPSSVPQLRAWVRRAGVRWGLDGQAKEREGLPASEAHTWAFGLDRLILGVAMHPEGWPLFEGLIAFDEVDAGHAEPIGALAGLLEELAALSRELHHPRPIQGWVAWLEGVLERCFSLEAAEEGQAQVLRSVLRSTAADARLAGLEAPVGFEVMRAHLLRAIPNGEVARTVERRAQRGLMLSGRVTFCELVPMRSIPFEVVCLVGMNDGAFPRPEPRLSFDLMRGSPRRGDRSRRDDDRYLFLECVLAARRCLYLSYIGFDAKDNGEVTPCAPLLELIDYLGSAFPLAGELVQRHPLQPFDPRYFEPGAALLSYHRGHCEGARALLGPLAPAGMLVAEPLPAETGISVSPEDFARFFEHPGRYFLHERLGVRLAYPEESLAETEPVRLTGLERYRVRQQLIELELAGEGARAEAVLRGMGLLPEGAAGTAAVLEERIGLRALAVRLGREGLGAEPEQHQLRLDLGAVTVQGPLTVARPSGWRPAALRARDQVGAWVRHLLTNAACGPTETCWLYLDKALRFAPVPDHADRLAELAAAVSSGFRVPLRLFPAAGLAYLEASDGARLDAARAAWFGTPGARGRPPESADRSHAWIYRDVDPIGRDFVAVTERLLTPLVGARTLADEGLG